MGSKPMLKITKLAKTALLMLAMVTSNQFLAQKTPNESREFKYNLQDAVTNVSRAVKGAAADAKTAWDGAVKGREAQEVQARIEIERKLRETKHAAEDIATTVERAFDELEPAAALPLCAISGILAIYNLNRLVHNLQQTERSVPHWLCKVAWSTTWLAAYGFLCYKTGQRLRA